MASPDPKSHTLITLYASALLKIQAQIDNDGLITAPYVAELNRAFNMAAALNVAHKTNQWPTDLQALLHAAQQPFYAWVPDRSWDSADDFFATRLIVGDEISNDCRSLARHEQHLEQELEENNGYALLMSLCHERADGEALYRTWRRWVIENPLLVNFAALLQNPTLANAGRIEELVYTFYQPIPAALSLKGQLAVCSISGTLLRPMVEPGQPLRFHTECRQPEAIRRAHAGTHRALRYVTGLRQLSRAFRTYWHFPGRAELDLEQQLRARGWQTTLWPRFDRVDLVAVAPSGRRLAIDVKDYLVPSTLAARFQGFKEFAATHECYVVIPDYLVETEPHFAERFANCRAALGKNAVTLRTLSQLLADVEAV